MGLGIFGVGMSLTKYRVLSRLKRATFGLAKSNKDDTSTNGEEASLLQGGPSSWGDLELAALGDLDSHGGSVSLASLGVLDLLNDFVALEDFTEDDITVTLGEITALDHEVLDDTVESRALITEALLASGQSAEVLSGLRDSLAVEAHDDTTEALLALLNVEVDLVGDLGTLGSLSRLGEEEKAKSQEQGRREKAAKVEHDYAMDRSGRGEAVFLLGVNFGEQKLVKKALESFYALGPTTSARIMAKYSIHKLAKVGSLAPRTVTSITAELSQMTIETDARRLVQDNIRRLKDMGSYRGRRHAMGLPVTTNNLGRINIADTLSKQFGNQIGIFADVLETLRDRWDTVKIGTDTNVIIPDKVANVDDVLGCVRESRVFWVKFGEAVFISCIDTRNEVRGDVNHDKRVALLDKLQNVILDVSGMGTDTPGGTVREDDRSFRASPFIFTTQNVKHSVLTVELD
ncbi:hypothetical protein HG530_007290 [Fusarium avenaceum]|nr:hypothetical protein HG530_007290 [Fusarium avenaceum]